MFSINTVVCRHEMFFTYTTVVYCCIELYLLVTEVILAGLIGLLFPLIENLCIMYTCWFLL